MNFYSLFAAWMLPSCKQTRCRVTETAGIKGFFQSQKMRALLWEQTVQLRIIPKNEDRSQSAPTLTKLARCV